MPKLNIKPGKPEHELEIRLSKLELKRLGELPEKQDSASLLKELGKRGIISGGQLDAQLSEIERGKRSLSQRVYKIKYDDEGGAKELREQRLQLKRVGISLARVVDQVQGREVPTAVQRSGVALKVKLLDSDGKLVYESETVPGLNLGVLFNQKWSKLEKDLTLVGVPATEIAERKRTYTTGLDKYEKARMMYSSGMQGNEIAEVLKANPEHVMDWITGRKVPQNLTWIFYKPYKLREFEIPKGHSQEFAYVMGVYATSVRKPTKELRATSRDRDAVEHFRKSAEQLLPQEEKDKAKLKTKKHHTLNGLPQFKCRLHSTGLMAYMEEITKGNRRIPWEHLVEEDERRAYLQALLDFNSSIPKIKARSHKKTKKPVVLITFSNRPEMAEDTLILCKTLGVYPNCVNLKGGVGRIIINGGDLEALQEVGFNAKRKAKLLKEQLSSAKHKVSEYGPEEYYKARELWRNGKSREEIAEQLGISIGAIKDWRHRNTKPPRVRRFEAIQKLEKYHPNPDVVGFLFRELGADSSISRAIAKQSTLEEVKEAWEMLAGQEADPKKRIALLAQKFVEVKTMPEKPKPLEEEKPRKEPTTLEGWVRTLVERYPRLDNPLGVIEVFSTRLADKFNTPKEDVLHKIEKALAKAGYGEKE